MRILKHLHSILFLLILAIAFLNADNCLADVTKDTTAQIVEQFKNKATLYGDIFDDYAKDLLGIILIIEIGFLGIKAALNRSEISEILVQFILVIATAAFFLAVINNYQTWTGNVINGLGKISQIAGGVELENPIYAGFDVATVITKRLEEADWEDMLGIIIAGLIVLICFALIGARVIIIKCEAYLAINAAIILLGFGASSFLREYAINVLRYVLSVAFKLFVMQLVLGVGMSFIADFKITSVKFEDLFILISSAVVLLVLISTLPETVAGIINGSHVGGGVGLKAATGAVAGAAATGAMVGAKVVGGTANLGATVGRAFKIASLQGHGGFAGAGSQLWKSYQEARQDEKRAGVGPSAIGEMRRMDASIKDMHTATRSASDPNYSGNEYSRNRFSGNPYGSNTAAGAQQGQQPNQSAQASAPFGATAGQAQAAADARSSGPHGAAPGKTPGADRDAPPGNANATSDAALWQQKKNSQTDRGR